MIFISAIVGSALFFARNFFRHQEELKQFLKTDVQGIIIKLDDLTRGSFSIEIRDNNNNYILPELPIAFAVKKYNVKVGDSLSKHANSKFITVYKLNNRIYEERCVLELY